MQQPLLESINEKSSTPPPSPVLRQEEAPASRLAVFGAVSFYMVAALVMIFVNKAVLNAVSVPIFFLFCQLAIAVLLLQGTAVLGYFALPPIRVQVAKDLLPLIAINVCGLTFNTYCLALVDASFYQVARGLVLPFTVFFSYILLSQRSTLPVLGAVVIVCIGFFAGVSAESLTVSKIGLFMGITSSITTSVHAIVVKRSLPVVQGDTMALAYYNNALSALFVSPIIVLMGEWPLVVDLFATGGENLKTFMIGAVVTGVFGFLICLAGFISIKITSPVTHMVSSAVRGVAQTFLGQWIFGDIISSGRATGIGFILFGSIVYTYAKSQESKAVIALPASPVRSPRPPTSEGMFRSVSNSSNIGSLSSPVLRHTANQSVDLEASEQCSPIIFAVHAPQEEHHKKH